MGKRTLMAMASCAVLAAAVALPASASGKQTLVIANCAKAKFKPANVIFTCGDASFGATGITWTAWTKNSASGSGTGSLNDCNPSCAQGKPKTAPITVQASKPVTCKKSGRRIFTRLSYTWTAGAPTGNVPNQGSIGLGCKLASL